MESGYSLSLDASTTVIGWSVWNGDLLVEYGKIIPLISELDWRDRIANMIPQVCKLVNKFKINYICMEDVPLFGKGGNKVLVQLGAIQGAMIGMASACELAIDFIKVGTWRKDIGISCGDKDRDSMKIKSLQLANVLFGLELNCVITPKGNYNAKKSDDDISDSILIYASTRDKYKVIDKTGFGRR